MVAEPGREKCVDLGVGIAHASWPGDAQGGFQPVDNSVRLGEQLLVAQENTRQLARGRLGVEHVPQPHEAADGKLDAVTRLERLGDVQRVADRRHNQGPRSEARQRLYPEGQQAADARILDDEQPAVAELVLEDGLCLVVELVDLRRRIPPRIEGPPLVCSPFLQLRPGRDQDLAVDGHYLGRLPESALVGGMRRDQVLRQVATQNAQDTGDGRCPAAVHAGYHHGNSRGGCRPAVVVRGAIGTAVCSATSGGPWLGRGRLRGVLQVLGIQGCLVHLRRRARRDIQKGRRECPKCGGGIGANATQL